ncbi:MAG: phosphotransferase enzyme family protein [Cognaticolwellia sp.]
MNIDEKMTHVFPNKVPNKMPDKALAAVLAQFGYALAECQINALGNGLINSTYLVTTPDKRFVLQQINQQVFKKPAQVIANADLLSTHLKTKYAEQSYALTPIWQLPSKSNETHVILQKQYWRCLHYIDNCYTLESITNTAQASAVANAFAEFTNAFNDFDSSQLADIIPQFHDLSMRLTQFEQAIANSSETLLKQAQSSIDYIHTQQFFINSVADITKKLPLRVTHNDTKINNLLFSHSNNNPVAVIDLDTCMAGYLMHDFGDMVRSCCSSIAEDSAKLDDMAIDFDILSALTTAYIAGFKGTLTGIEHSSLLLGIKLMPFMLGIRFLTDFLNGDNYFKTDNATHNLVRAKNQLQLYKLFCQHDERLTDIVLSHRG